MEFSYMLENENPKIFFIFQETEISYISGNGTLRARKIKKNNLKKFLIF